MNPRGRYDSRAKKATDNCQERGCALARSSRSAAGQSAKLPVDDEARRRPSVRRRERAAAARRGGRRLRGRPRVARPRDRRLRPRRARARPAAAARRRRGLRRARGHGQARHRGHERRPPGGPRRLRPRGRRAPLQRLRAPVRARHLRAAAGVTAPVTTAAALLAAEELRLLDAYWRAANYLSVGQIYLLSNPLLREPLRPDHVKPRLLGHFGTTPGLNLIYAHLNRAIRARDLNAIYVCGPGHGGPGVVANAYLEGTYSELYSHVTQDEEGLKELFRQFSFPGGIPSHAAPETPGSIHEGGELGYALAHAFGA